MPADPNTLSAIQQFGTTGFCLMVLWWIYKDFSARADKKDEAFRALEKEVRTEITTQLISATATISNAQKIMEKIIAKLD